MLDGKVLPDDAWHTVFDADGHWVIGLQLGIDHVPPPIGLTEIGNRSTSFGEEYT